MLLARSGTGQSRSVSITFSNHLPRFNLLHSRARTLPARHLCNPFEELQNTREPLTEFTSIRDHFRATLPLSPLQAHTHKHIYAGARTHAILTRFSLSTVGAPSDGSPRLPTLDSNRIEFVEPHAHKRCLFLPRGSKRRRATSYISSSLLLMGFFYLGNEACLRQSRTMVAAETF